MRGSMRGIPVCWQIANFIIVFICLIQSLISEMWTLHVFQEYDKLQWSVASAYKTYGWRRATTVLMHMAADNSRAIEKRNMFLDLYRLATCVGARCCQWLPIRTIFDLFLLHTRCASCNETPFNWMRNKYSTFWRQQLATKKLNVLVASCKIFLPWLKHFVFDHN